MFGNIGKGYKLTVQSIKVIMKEPHLLALPIISGFLFFLVMLSFVLPGIFIPILGNLDLYWAGAGIILYFVSFFLMYFTQFMVVGVAKKRFEGQDPTFNDGLNTAMAHISTIVIFSIIGSILAILSNAMRGGKKGSIGNILGPIIASVLGAAWTVITYLSIPIIVSENISLFDSFKKSGEIVKNNFSEGMGAVFAVGIIFLVPTLLGIGIIVLGIFLLVSGMVIPGILIILLGGLVCVLASIVQKVVNAIVGQALYYYSVHKQFPEVFEGVEIN
ncbi:hypothetical protein KO465_09570 [Candidatus Micrarchaeota archaeon]|nr:hypothetical protein [Candidatus Micrarchaeota archaeon]